MLKVFGSNPKRKSKSDEAVVVRLTSSAKYLKVKREISHVDLNAVETKLFALLQFQSLMWNWKELVTEAKVKGLHTVLNVCILMRSNDRISPEVGGTTEFAIPFNAACGI